MFPAGIRAKRCVPRRVRSTEFTFTPVVLSLIAGFSLDPAWSSTRVPDDRATAVFYKSLGYDEHLIKTYPEVRVLVVSFSERSFPRAAAVQAALDIVAGEARTTNPASMMLDVELAPYASGTFEQTIRGRSPQILYLVTEGDAESRSLHDLRELSLRFKVPMIIDDPDLLQGFGTLSAAVVTGEDVPQLWIHLRRAKQQGCRFDAKFLRLCKVVDR